jgi:alanine dehydrogenase
LPYVLRLATQGLDALRADPEFGKGVNTYRGAVTSQPVAEALDLLSQYRAFATL